MNAAGNPDLDLKQRAADTIAFLGMAAAQLRSLADRSPDIAVELHHMARQLDCEADDLAKLSSG